MIQSSKGVFLSYASEDADVAKHICDALRMADIEVWFDQSELRGGDAWDQKIRQQIRDCALFVPIISAHTQRRPEGYFRLEWKLAVDRSHLMAAEKAFLVPVVVDATTEPEALVPAQFREVQWTRVQAGEVQAAFVARIAALLNQPVAHHVGSPERAVNRAPRNRLPVVLIALAVAAVVGLVIAMAMRGGWLRHKPALKVEAGTAPAPVATTPAAIPEKSVAVLPFVDMSEKHDQEYFADGLCEELIDRLSHSADLRVIARTSSFYFKGKPSTIANIASALHVTHVLEGSVRKSGNALRITAQLIQATDGTHLWSQTYDRKLSDIFKLQDELAATVAAALNATIRGLPVTAAGTSNVDAYNLMLEGYFFYERGNSGDNGRAIDSYRRALTLDPNFAYGWARLAAVYLAEGFSASPEINAQDTEREARAAVSRAIALDPKLPIAHQLLGSLEAYLRWNWSAAQAEFERALTLSADKKEQLRIRIDLENLRALRMDRYSEELIRLLLQQLDDDPLDSNAILAVANAYIGNDRFEEAQTLVARLLSINPNYVAGNAFMAVILLHMSKLDEAFAAAQKETDDNTRLSTLAQVTWSMGRHDESDRYLAEFTKRFSKLDPYSLAWMHAWRGEKDQAFEWLDRAYQAHASGITEMRLELPFRSLRGDPRFTALLHKMDLMD